MEELDVSLLDGFEFTCRPGCGLCCFANPAVGPEERVGLIQIRPALEFLDGDDGYVFLTNRPNGGACELLSDAGCGAHSARPFPCRSFPISVHLGSRAQASVVLACPGLSLARLEEPTARGAVEAARGLDAELAAVRAEMERPVARTASQAAAVDYTQALVRQRTRPGWIEPEEFRSELAHRDRWAELVGYPEPPPEPDADADSIPVAFLPDLGVVGLAGEDGRWSVRTMPEAGGGRTLGTYDLPRDPPRLDGPARRLLGAYLRYAFDRDAPFGQLLWSLRRSRDDWEDALWTLVDEAASLVVTRAALLALARGETPVALGRATVLDGIRASDADLLDRPTIGAVL